MNKLLFAICSFCFLANVMWAQAPQEISYQVIVHDAANNLVKNKAVSIQISILPSPVATAVFTETHTVNTNANALASIVIGKGTKVLGSLASIDWSTGSYYLKTEIDPTGGTNYTTTLVSQFLSVPYALFANGADYNSVISKPDFSVFANKQQYDSVLANVRKVFADTLGTVKDFDGYRYPLVTIGNQVWLGENLRTTHLNDGTLIPNLEDSASWYSTVSPAYCWPGHNEAWGRFEHGALYNYSAVMSNKLCPIGFHVPDSLDIVTLNANMGFIPYLVNKDRARYWSSGFFSNFNLDDRFGMGLTPPIIRNRPSSLTQSEFFFTIAVQIMLWAKNQSAQPLMWMPKTATEFKITTFAFDLQFNTAGAQVRCVKD